MPLSTFCTDGCSSPIEACCLCSGVCLWGATCSERNVMLLVMGVAACSSAASGWPLQFQSMRRAWQQQSMLQVTCHQLGGICTLVTTSCCVPSMAVQASALDKKSGQEIKVSLSGTVVELLLRNRCSQQLACLDFFQQSDIVLACLAA